VNQEASQGASVESVPMGRSNRHNAPESYAQDSRFIPQDFEQRRSQISKPRSPQPCDRKPHLNDGLLQQWDGASLPPNLNDVRFRHWNGVKLEETKPQESRENLQLDNLQLQQWDGVKSEAKTPQESSGNLQLDSLQPWDQDRSVATKPPRVPQDGQPRPRRREALILTDSSLDPP
jgi:hypothetical protein